MKTSFEQAILSFTLARKLHWTNMDAVLAENIVKFGSVYLKRWVNLAQVYRADIKSLPKIFGYLEISVIVTQPDFIFIIGQTWKEGILQLQLLNIHNSLIFSVSTMQITFNKLTSSKTETILHSDYGIIKFIKFHWDLLIKL